MRKIILVAALILGFAKSEAQIMETLKKIDFSKINLSSLLHKTLQVKQGWAPKFSFASLGLASVEKVSKIINLKNIATAKKLFNTFKTGRTIYKAGAYVGLAASTYSGIKNMVESNKEAVTAEAKALKTEAIHKAQNFLTAGAVTIGAGVLIKFLTKKAASKAADAFNGMIKRKIKDILSFDVPSASLYTKTGVALKIKI
jgi:hypothetical protein